MLISQHSDVDAKSKDVFKSSRLVHLESEDYVPPPDSLALTTTKSIPAFMMAWWREFAQRDLSGSEPRQVKWGSIHKVRENKPSFKPYTPGDDVLVSEALADPQLIHAWLPQPPRRLEFHESDAKHFEAQTRKTLNTVSFIEAVLQALRKRHTPENFSTLVRALTPATKVVMQFLTSMLCQWVQVRRDHWLHKANTLSDVDLRLLRHAPIVGTLNLFPASAMAQVARQSEECMRYSAFLNLAKQGQAGQAKEKGQQNNRFFRQIRLPDFARDPFVVRHFTAVVSPKKRRPSPRARTIVEQVSAERVHHTPRYYDEDAMLLANDHQVSAWNLEYVRAVQLAQASRFLPVGGRLQHHADDWTAIGASRRVVKWLKKGFRLPFIPDGRARAVAMQRRECPRQLCIHYSDPIKQTALYELIDKLLDKDVIEQVPAGTKALHNLIFLRPKPNGTWRGITDTSPLNEFLHVKKFKMDTPQVIRQALTPALWATSVDFSDAYYHIPVHEDHRQFLAFQVGNTRYWFKATPFGLSPLPQVFTEIFTTLKVYARKTLGVMVFQYIDDWLLMSHDRARLAEKSIEFANLCTNLGIIVNFDKSELVPTQRLTHLGVDWNFATCEVKPPLDKVNKVRHHLALMINARRAQIRTLESIRGTLSSLEKVVPYGRINFRYFQSFVTNQLRQGRHPRWLQIPHEALLDLHWWLQENNLLAGTPFTPPSPHIIVTSDASTQGWGASFEGLTLAGRWRGPSLERHINWLEMEAVRLTILNRARVWRGKCIKFLIDNRTTVAYINKQGGTRSDEMTQLTRELLNLAHKNDITLQAHHLAGELNAVADLLSRKGQVIKTEWQLHKDSFYWVQRISPFGPATVDLFANSLNKQLPRYGSPHHDEKALLVDALVAPWPTNEIIYAFPPTTILDRVLARIRDIQPPRLLLVAPDTPTTTWFPLLNDMHWRKLSFPNARLLQPHWPHEHPDPASAHLALWVFQDFAYSRVSTVMTS